MIPVRVTAAAVADLGAVKLEAAGRYIADFGELGRAGVPLSLLASILPTPRPTVALAAVEHWVADGEAAALVLHGAPGCGKSYAAARWVLGRRRRNLGARWVDASALAMADLRERDRLLTRLVTDPALVVDDVGAGAQNDYLRDQIRGLIQARIDGLRCTVIVSNASHAQISDYLGPRIVSRLRTGGGVADVSGADLREPKRAEVDALGRGPAWMRASRICNLLEHLDTAARRHGDDALTPAIEALGLTRAAVDARAAELFAEEQATAKQLAQDYGAGVDRAIQSFEDLMDFARARMVAAAKQAAEEDREKLERHRAKAATRQASASASTAIHELPEAPEWAKGVEGRKRLKKLGFNVVQRGDTYRTVYNDRVLQLGLSDSVTAWDVAARTCAEIGTEQ